MNNKSLFLFVFYFGCFCNLVDHVELITCFSCLVWKSKDIGHKVCKKASIKSGQSEICTLIRFPIPLLLIR